MHTLLFNLYASLALTAGIGVIISKNPIHSVIFLILVFCNATGLLLLFKIELLAMMFMIIYVGAIAVLFLFVVMMLNIKIIKEQPSVPSYTTKQQTSASGSGILSSSGNELKISQTYTTFLKIIQAPIIMSSISFALIMLILSFILSASGNSFYNNPFGSPMWPSGTEYQDIVNQINILWNNQQVLQKSWIILVTTTTNIQTLGYLIYTYYFYYFIMASLILLLAMIGAIVLTMYKRKHASKKQYIYKQVARTFETAISLTN